MTGSMETITAYMILLVVLIRHCVEVCIVWHRAMEGIIEYRYLRSIRHQGVYSADTFEMTGIVNRCKIAETFYTILYFLSYDTALLEKVTTLHDTMTHSIDFIEALDGTNLLVKENFEDERYAFLMCRQITLYNFILAIRQ